MILWIKNTMRLLIQQVASAILDIESEKIHREIWKWLIIYFWVHDEDYKDYKGKIARIIKKIPLLKCLSWEDWAINTSLNDINWEILFISNFTLYWRSLKGTKLDFVHSAPFKEAKEIYDYFIVEAKKAWRKIQTWEFWADMTVRSCNLWPLNFILDY